MKKIVFMALTCALLAGCASQKTLVPTAGSKADGTVVMAYEYGSFEKPVVDPEQGKKDAIERCKKWGYTDAEAFTPTESCLQTNAYGSCLRVQVKITYQCSGDKAADEKKEEEIIRSSKKKPK